ncbi:phytoene desaturase family protein [Pinibacter aurantiacus]|uniref:NAD(P)/FAD-dependent oxidoreductase n=1 Tax=Pinibacter aurantiacus TaxID=2851599 RepID=A0A9E2S8I2_9BACT|nr:NAD(P)/FAD-dependent oxidoreductase [Pinibacter aurantiacus]MBV4355925.1 NAD(P)/FAD-dependent oxidoreductase [Pinibacter aurantiacus]
MKNERKDYDAVVVGAGPNGLAATITLQQAGLSVLLIEAKETIGGGMRTAELTLPGFKHDVCSAIHPMAVMSPFFKTLPLHDFGLEWIQPTNAAAHPFDDGSAAVLTRSLETTAQLLNSDKEVYQKVFGKLVKQWKSIQHDVLGPLHFPEAPISFADFGLKALLPATQFAKRFQTEKAKGLWAGITAHSVQPLDRLTTSAIGLVLTIAAHAEGWPIPKGGSQVIADAMTSYFLSLGGKIEIGTPISSLKQLPSARAVLFDVSPKQLLQIAGHDFSSIYKSQLSKYRYGMGVFKIDWALDDAIPFTAAECRQAGTVHIGNTLTEIAANEKATWHGSHPDKPFVLLAQQSLFDTSRAPEGKHVAWAYCHVPNGSTKDMTTAIENQVERFAPGFKERIIGRHTFNTSQLEQYNANYIGGDVIGGATDIGQLFTRPALRYSPYRTSTKGIYICSASTPPGGGVHGMCGYHAASRVLKDLF